MNRASATIGGVSITMAGAPGTVRLRRRVGSDSAGPTAASTADPAVADESAATGDGTTAASDLDLDFTATTLDGTTSEGASLVGKPALLWF